MPDRRLLAHRLPALVFAAFLVLIAASAAVLFALKMGTSPARVALHLRGDEATFTPARSLDGLLLVAVPHLVAIPLVLFAASHVVGWARVLPGRAYRALLGLSFGAAALSVAGSFLVRFVAPELAWVKIAAFAGLEAGLLAWAALLVRVFLFLGGFAPLPAASGSRSVGQRQLPARSPHRAVSPGDVAESRPSASTTMASTPASRASRNA